MPILNRSNVLTAIMGTGQGDATIVLVASATAMTRCVPAVKVAAPSLPGTSMSGLVLYQRDDCHLCDQALEVLAQARAPEPESVFIDDDTALEDRYGVRVPVLRDGRGRELDWPFDVAALQRWLQG